MKTIFIQSKFTAKLLSALVALFIYHAAFAQVTIHGKVLRSVNEPAINASALLLKAKDSLLIKAMVCDKDGGYSFTNIHEGKYIVSTTMVGYKPAFSSIININYHYCPTKINKG